MSRTVDPLLDPETMGDYEVRVTPAPETHGYILVGLRNLARRDDVDRIFLLDRAYKWKEITPTGSFDVGLPLVVALSAATVSFIDDLIAERAKTPPNVTASLVYN